MRDYFFSLDAFPSGRVHPGLLGNEIRYSSISVAFDCVNTDENGCTIKFKADLSEEDENALNALVTNHAGEITGPKRSNIKRDNIPAKKEPVPSGEDVPILELDFLYQATRKRVTTATTHDRYKAAASRVLVALEELRMWRIKARK